MTKSRMNKNDRKRQRRKDFSYGRDWQTTPQDQRSTYPKSSVAQRADAARRAQLAGIRTKPFFTKLPGPGAITNVDIDLRPGALNYVTQSTKATDMMRLMRDLVDAQMLSQLYGIGPTMIGIDFALEPSRPSLHREMKVGEILAYRCWRLEDGLLRSVYIRDVWYPHQIMQGRGIEDWSERGIHAWKDLNSAKFNEYVRGYLGISRDPWQAPRTANPAVIVTGKVHLWGDVVEHEHGYRAEYARIISLDWLYPDARLMGREQETLAHLRTRYGVS